MKTASSANHELLATGAHLHRLEEVIDNLLFHCVHWHRFYLARFLLLSLVMVEKKASLQRDDLIRLRKLLQRNANATGSVPLEELVLMADLPEETGVTIDFEAAEELGHPLVVLRPSEALPSALASLSTREREVAALIALGLTNKEIAARLHIALGTVKDHVHNMLAKTGLANRTALATTFQSSAKLPSLDADVNPSLDRN